MVSVILNLVMYIVYVSDQFVYEAGLRVGTRYLVAAAETVFITSAHIQELL